MPWIFFRLSVVSDRNRISLVEPVTGLASRWLCQALSLLAFMNVSISLHWTPPLHFHGWERGRPVFTGPGGFQAPQQQVSHSWRTLGIFFFPSFLQKDAAQSPGSWKQWLKPDRWDKSHSAFKSGKSFQRVSASEKQAASASDAKAAAGRAGWRLWVAAWGVFGGVRPKKVDWKTQTKASFSFYPRLLGFTRFFCCFLGPKGADCALSGSGQSGPPSERRLRLWSNLKSNLRVFASITVCRGAGMLRGGAGAIIRSRSGFSRKETLGSNVHAERSDKRVHTRCRPEQSQVPSAEMWDKRVQLRGSVQPLSEAEEQQLKMPFLFHLLLYLRKKSLSLGEKVTVELTSANTAVSSVYIWCVVERRF